VRVRQTPAEVAGDGAIDRLVLAAARVRHNLAQTLHTVNSALTPPRPATELSPHSATARVRQHVVVVGVVVDVLVLGDQMNVQHADVDAP